jgi:hypothetical protein
MLPGPPAVYMVLMLAVELGQALPKIVVTCSADSKSLSMKRIERDTAAVNSSEWLRSPSLGVESSVGYDVLGLGLSFAKEKNHIIDPGPWY